MFMVSINNSSINNFKQQQFDISKKRTFINAVDTIDLEVNNCSKEFNAIQKTGLVCFAAIFSFVMAELSEKFRGNKLNKLSGSKIFPLVLGTTASTALLFGLLNKKRADGMYKSIILAQNNAEKVLSNPNLFLNISDKKQEYINKNPVYAYYNKEQYQKEQNFFPDFKIIKHKNFLHDMKFDVKNFQPVADKTNEHLEALKQIDNKTQDYIKKITAGVNLFFATGNLVLGGIFFALEKIVKAKYKEISAFIPAIAIIPLLYMTNSVSNEKFNNIEMISRQKAKEDFIENKNNDKNFLQTTLEYLKTKKEYEQKVLRQKDLVPLKNNILSNMGASDDEINEAKNFQMAFVNAVKSESRMKNIKKNMFSNSMSQDLIQNSMMIPVLYLLAKGFENSENKLNKSLLTLFTLLAGAYATNAGLTLLLNKNVNTSKIK